jgi:hypothetical protein
MIIDNPLSGCTTFIISGKNTADGKPILYKQRDTGTLDNALAFFNDGKYTYIGVVNGNKRFNQELFGGFNSAGFAIINSVAYNMNVGDTTSFMDQEGEIMKMALMYCASVDDFEMMLQDLPKPLGADANFGVIDANGGAAYFETGNYHFNKIDVNDPAVAPFGYLIRTNHAFTGSPEKGAGYIRYATAENILYDVAAAKRYKPQYLINRVSRNLTHSLTGDNLALNIPDNSLTPDYRFFEDFLPRYSTASAMMVVGSAINEDPSNIMMWNLLGFPLTTVSIPVWITSDGALPDVVKGGDNYHSAICDASLALKRGCFPITRGSGKKYIDISKVLNKQGDGTLQKIEGIENEIFSKAERINAMPAPNRDATIKEYYNWLDIYIESNFKNLFNLEIQ